MSEDAKNICVALIRVFKFAIKIFEELIKK